MYQKSSSEVARFSEAERLRDQFAIPQPSLFTPLLSFALQDAKKSGSETVIFRGMHPVTLLLHFLHPGQRLMRRSFLARSAFDALIRIPSVDPSVPGGRRRWNGVAIDE